MSTTGTSESPVVSDEVVALDPDDEGLGNIRPDEVVALDPDDEGLGNIRPDEVVHVNGAG
jgi:hypothetical protein